MSRHDTYEQALAHLHRCLQVEVMCSPKPFSWLRTIHKAIKCPDRRFNFWWRIASHLFQTGGKRKKNLALRINRGLLARYGADFGLGASIGEGLRVLHTVGTTITSEAVIGKNFVLRQNTTIGTQHPERTVRVQIGDNVNVGANSCIIGDDFLIGDNTTIGAMSYINKSIPPNSIVYTKKTNQIVEKTQPAPAH